MRRPATPPARAVLSCMALALFSGTASIADHNDAALHGVADCRYLTTENPDSARDSEHLGSTWFPQGDLFRPPIADMRQPRFYLTWRRVTFQGSALPAGGIDDRIRAGIVAIGTDYGIWRRTRGRRCNGFQVDVMGGIFSQFNLDAESDDLINTDFLIGPSVSWRSGGLSTRVRLYHQSSHLGDEFILGNPDVDRVNLSFEAVDVLVAYGRSWWRIYGGPGAIFGADPRLAAGTLQCGFEARAPRRRGATRWTPVFGVDFNSYEERDGEITTSVMGGIEMSNWPGTRRFRLMLTHLRGFIPFGQFFNTERITSFGVHLHFDP